MIDLEVFSVFGGNKMTFEVLNETTILVELTFEEMKKYHITYETLDSNNNAIKNILNVI